MGSFKGNFTMPTVCSARTKTIIQNALALTEEEEHPMVCPEIPERVTIHVVPELNTARRVKKTLFQYDYLLDYENTKLYEERTPFFKSEFDIKEFTMDLPPELQGIKSNFESLETVFKLTTQPNSFVTVDFLKEPFYKLKQSELTLSDIGRIVYVYPNAYDIQISLDSSDVFIRQKLSNETRTVVELEQRKTTLRKLLFNWAHKCHKVFLTCQVPPIYVDTNALTAWHPFFDLTQVNVPPANGLGRIEPVVYTEKVLDSAMDFFQEYALTVSSFKLCQLKASQQKLIAELTKPLKQKEAEKRLADMKSLLKDIRFIYVLEKKNILSMDFILNRTYFMYNGARSKSTITEIINCLTEKASRVIRKKVIGNNVYIKFNMGVDLNAYDVQL